MKTISVVIFFMVTAVINLSYATSVTSVGSTLDEAEETIAKKTRENGAASYVITQAYYGNKVHMTARLK